MINPDTSGAEVKSATGAARAAVILLVEDSIADVRLMQEVLRESGFPHELLIAGDGEKALRAIRREGEYAGGRMPDIVLLDLNLPGIDGREVLRTIKSDPALRRTPKAAQAPTPGLRLSMDVTVAEVSQSGHK